jgi:hypothetical protein
MKRIIFFPLFFLTLTLMSQVNQDLRREFAVGNEYDNFTVAPFGEAGVLVFGSDRISLSALRWKFLKLESGSFSGVDSLTFDMPRQLRYRFHEQTDNELVVMFANEKRRTYRISVLDFATMQVSHFNGNIPRKSNLIEMVVSGNQVYVALRSRRSLQMLVVDTDRGNMRLHQIKSEHGKNIWLEGIEAHPETSSMLLYVNTSVKSRRTITTVQAWEMGQKQHSFDIASPSDRNLMSISGSILGDDHYIFTGAYSTRQVNTANGFFIAEVQDGRRRFIEYYDFMELDNFNDYLPRRQQSKLDRKKARREARGKTLSLNYRLVSHPVVKVNDKYYFLAEFYYPTYRTETTTTTTNTGTTTTTRTVFDGYQFTHASMICFNDAGEKLWDNTFEMFLQHKPYHVRRFITFSIDQTGRADLFYTNRKHLNYKAFNSNGDILYDRQKSGFDTGSEDDKVRSTVSNMVPWYGDHFLAYGVQRVTDQNQRIGSNRTRRVYFLTKVTPK